MASIRTRITASYALAFAGTLFAFSAVVWAERRSVAKQDLLDRASETALLGLRILGQSGPGVEQITIDTTAHSDSLSGRQLTTRYKALLDVLSGYVLIA